MKDYNAGNKDNQTGIGAELSQVASYLYVIVPMKGWPADQAGLRAGDIIEYIDNKVTRDISLYDAKQLLNGAAGTEVKLRVLRANSSPLTVNVKRGTSRAAAAETRMEAGKVGVLRINSSADTEATEVRNRLQDLIKQGAQKIVLDLRDTAGGSINEAVAVANLFIKDGVLAQTVGREGKALKTFSADPKAVIFSGPVVAMIDTGTAGAAEVVASALIERQRGQVVGENLAQPDRQLRIALAAMLLEILMRFQQRLLDDIGGIKLGLQTLVQLQACQQPQVITEFFQSG